MRGIVEQRVATQVGREKSLAIADGLLGGHVVESGGAPHVVGCLDDEGAGLGVERVGVGLKPAPFGLLEGKGEGGESLMCAQPDELAAASLDLRLEKLRISAANAAVGACYGDHQIGPGSEVALIRHLGLEAQLDA